MSQPVLLRASLPVAFIRLMQSVVPALAIGLSLYAITQFHGVDFDRLFVALAAVAVILSVVILQPPPQDSPILQIDAGAMAIDVFFRWAITLGLLFGLGYITNFDEHYPRRIVLPWAVIAPLLALGVVWLLQVLMRRVVMSRENRRSAVIVGVNVASLQLAERMTTHRELFLSPRIRAIYDRLAAGLTDYIARMSRRPSQLDTP